MSAIETNRSVPMGAITTFQIVSFFERGIGAVRAARNIRATRRALESLSDGQLSDIGLRRGQINSVAEALARD